MVAADLIELLQKFLNVKDTETHQALFRTNVPSVAPEGSEHPFKPQPPELCDLVAKSLPEGQLFDRQNLFGLLPFNVEGVNKEFRRVTSATKLTCIGSYGYDRSMACIDRATLEIVCFTGKDFTKERRRWATFDEWLCSEIGRMCSLHDEFVNRLVEKRFFLPGSPNYN